MPKLIDFSVLFVPLIIDLEVGTRAYGGYKCLRIFGVRIAVWSVRGAG